MTERDGLAVIARCPRAKSDMTPCMRRDKFAADDDRYCVGCGLGADEVADELRDIARGAVEEVERLRAGIQWARGMCSDGESDTEIDAYLGSLLNEPGGRSA